ncbi:ABC transporter ATP-binding protein [Lactobacillus sp. ESL0791]|uniref:ATP-binding cassette domain-containing protein n=1 Tax=Lactobacillus sp. ESL0791 TaxID=2983234 RepID=UPI0023F755F9|nr:ABC transporter ATP-binding protein [Lactobacillus sp. ESL0791]MDF7637944.1 ABC transporter ATP-binding protein [Lactobacillus sp. ESL0791]
MAVITSKNLTFSYDDKTNILDNLTLSIPSGKFSLLIGPTGCGKSTFLKLLAGLYPKYAGKVSGKIDVGGLTHAMMFQNAGEQFTMRTPREEIIFALENLRVSKEDYQKRLIQAVSFAQIDDLLDQAIVTLSGGQQQKVALAVLMAMDVDLFLLDEPFASCDNASRKFLISKLAKLRDQGKTIIISDHILSDYQNVCDAIFKFTGQKIVPVDAKEQQHLLQSSTAKVTGTFALPTVNLPAAFSFTNTAIRQNHLLLQQEKLTIVQGKAILLTGPNGVGKTSLFKALTKMLPYTGSLTYQDKEISKLSDRKYLLHVAQIFQNATDQFLSVTVEDELNLSKKNCKNSFFTDKKITQALEYLDLDRCLDQIVYSLSGGQKKKLQILLMLLSDQDVLLIDEPLSGLDHESSKKIIHLLQESQKERGQTILLISHELTPELCDWCDYHLEFNQQKLTYTKEAAE